eukprot:TRINITY_DN47527_c0_g1_i1.p1 TRINITY_DN47527_c0_g1~~TRINITY_DN47527_c0_g1_i1.p1  ORF type:complete len:964 (+),score=375.38 TRINITY_DN47527_c0_g1_i1:45-2894(+)
MSVRGAFVDLGQLSVPAAEAEPAAREAEEPSPVVLPALRQRGRRAEGYAVGVDFGSDSVRGYAVNERGGVSELPGARAVPALVALTDHLLVGKAARRERETKHSNCARHLVTWLRVAGHGLRLQHPKSPTQVLLPELVCALVLNGVFRTAAGQARGKPLVCNVAVHPTVRYGERLRLVGGAVAAGVRVELVHSPVALAAQYCRQLVQDGRTPPKAGRLVVVLDMGARHTSAGLFRLRPGQWGADAVAEVLELAGVEIGGYDLDDAVASASALAGKAGRSILLNAAEAAKQDLTGVRSTQIRARDESCPLTREQLHDTAADTIIPVVRGLLREVCGDRWEEVRADGAAVVAGGGSRLLLTMPDAAWEGGPPAEVAVVDPDHACAMGAATLASGAVAVADPTAAFARCCGQQWWALDSSKLPGGDHPPERLSRLPPIRLFGAAEEHCPAGRRLHVFTRQGGTAAPTPAELRDAMRRGTPDDLSASGSASASGGGVAPESDGTLLKTSAVQPQLWFCGVVATGVRPAELFVGYDGLFAADPPEVFTAAPPAVSTDAVAAMLSAEMASEQRVKVLLEARNELQDQLIRVEDLESDDAAQLLAAVVPDAGAVLALAQDWSEDYNLTTPYQPGDVLALARVVESAVDAHEEGAKEPPSDVVCGIRQVACFLPGADSGSTGELSDLRAAFNAYDVSGDAVLTVDELREVLRRLGLSPSPTQLAAALKRADVDGSGSVDFSEFLDIMSTRLAAGYRTLRLMAAQRHTGTVTEDVRTAAHFAFCRKDRYLTEFAYHVRAVGPCADDLKKFFAAFDRDGDGSITPEELRQVLKRAGIAASDDAAAELLRKADADGSGSIEIAEFIAAVQAGGGLRSAVAVHRAAREFGGPAQHPSADELRARRRALQARQKAAELMHSFDAWYRLCGPTLEALVRDAARESRRDPAVASYVSAHWAALQ